MSEEIKEMTNEEAMKALGEFATMCYNKGTKMFLLVLVLEQYLEW